MSTSHKNCRTNVSECLNLQSLHPAQCEFYLYIFVMIDFYNRTPPLAELFATEDENVIFVFLFVKATAKHR